MIFEHDGDFDPDELEDDDDDDTEVTAEQLSLIGGEM